MSPKEQLEADIKAAEVALENAKLALEEFESSIENNVFASLDEASWKLEDRLRDQARADCEGSHCCGAAKYWQEFMVDGVKYLGTLSVEYNRHDKTYYYIECANFSHTKVEE